MVEISKQAVKAAIEAAGMEGWDHVEERMKAALTAAAPYMSGANKTTITECIMDFYGSDYAEGKRVFYNPYTGEVDAHDLFIFSKPAFERKVQERILSALEPFQLSIGWLYDSDDAGTEFSENHPIESGECSDAKDIKPATAENLRSELLISWKAWAEDREELNKLRDAPSSAREQALEEAEHAVGSTVLKHRPSDYSGLSNFEAYEAGQLNGLERAQASLRALKSQPAPQTGGGK